MILGVDYASVDGNEPPDFAAAHRWGARFALIRAAFTFGSSAHTDPTWMRDHVAARAAGLQVAPYLILGWSVEPEAQVAQLITTYRAPAEGDLPVALDIEGVSGLAPTRALAQVEAAVTALRAHYRTVMIYTSNHVWTEQLGDLPSGICGECPLWLKVGYPWKARNAPHIDDIPRITDVPPPWRALGSPGAFIEQFQGDAVGVPGFAHTVDLNVFLPYVAAAADPRTGWIRARLAATGFPSGATSAQLVSALRAFQAACGLVVDGVMGPVTWAALCA